MPIYRILICAAWMLPAAVNAAAAGVKLEDHKFIKATAAAEICLGYRPSMRDELRLARLISEDEGHLVSILDVATGLEAAREAQKPCDRGETQQAITFFNNELRPRLQEPVLNAGPPITESSDRAFSGEVGPGT